MDLLSLVGLAAAALTTARALPQLWRTVTSRNPAGVPVGTVALSSVTVSAWCWYGAANGLWALAVSSAVCATALAATAATATVARRRWRPLVPAAGWAAVICAVVAVGSPTAVGVVLLAAPTAHAAGIVLEMRRANDLSGLSPTTWTLDLCEGVLWIAYAAVASDPLLAVNSLVLCSADVYVLARWARWRTTPAVPAGA
jgi:hypothetical protein